MSATMRKIYFLYPRMNLNVGGHLAQVKLLEAAKQVCPAEAVTYETQEDGTLFLDSVLEQDNGKDSIYIIHWGPHVADLVRRLSDRNVVYVSYTTGWGFTLPTEVPIIAGSKHTQAYWGRYSPNSLIHHLPCVISDNFINLHRERDIDILVQKRKSSHYLLEELVPRLQGQARVTVIDSWVDDLSEMFNRSKVYLYESTEHWGQMGVSEGFGLPPLEAMACGCTVFSSINDALSDYLDPGFNCQKLRVYSPEYDVERILSAVKDWQDVSQWNYPAQDYRRNRISRRLEVILSDINDFFDRRRFYSSSIESPRYLSNEAKIRSLEARISQMENSRGWKLLERFRAIYARLLRILKPSN